MVVVCSRRRRRRRRKRHLWSFVLCSKVRCRSTREKTFECKNPRMVTDIQIPSRRNGHSFLWTKIEVELGSIVPSVLYVHSKHDRCEKKVLRSSLKAEIFAYIPRSVMRLGYSTGYASAIAPFFCPRVVAFPGQQNLHTSGCIPPKRSRAASALEPYFIAAPTPSVASCHIGLSEPWRPLPPPRTLLLAPRHRWT